MENSKNSSDNANVVIEGNLKYKIFQPNGSANNERVHIRQVGMRFAKVLYWIILSVVVLLSLASSVAISDEVESVFALSTFIVLSPILTFFSIIIFNIIVSVLKYITLGDVIDMKRISFRSHWKNLVKYYIAIIIVSVVTYAISADISDRNLNENNVSPISNSQENEIVQKEVNKRYYVDDMVNTPLEIQTKFVSFVNIGNIVSDDFGYSSYDKIQTGGTFVKYVFNIQNTATSTKLISVENLTLTDEKNREYKPTRVVSCINPLSDFGQYEDYYIFRTSAKPINLKPGIPCRISLLIEVPTDIGKSSVSYTF